MTCREQSQNLESTKQSSSTTTTETSPTNESQPVWCPEQQIYIGGVVPSTSSSPDLSSLLEENNGWLRIFGYGSLCWNPGEGAILSHENVTRSLGRAIGWRRCWAQKSADHRGTPFFSGIVCTLLSDEEVNTIHQQAKLTTTPPSPQQKQPPSMVEGMVYQVPPTLAQACLSELDFREKGGYARDVITVLDDETGETVRALLYRGTPENPAFWKRALLDLPFAAATMSVSVGPSGPNDAYLYNLDTFLTHASKQLSLSEEDHVGDADTRTLASMTRTIQDRLQVYFMFGAGSNQHGQLALSEQTHAAVLQGKDEVGELTELVLAVAKTNGKASKEPITPNQLYAGGGHSALLTSDGQLYLWGWNEMGQLGRRESIPQDHAVNGASDLPIPPTPSLQGISNGVSKAALGHSHTLVLERDTGVVYAFGDNARGQLGIATDTSTFTCQPTIPTCLQDTPCMDIAAGLFHSAVITEKDGALMTLGCGKFGQSLPEADGISHPRWKPDDGSRLVQVSCGRRHTMVLDEHGRVWTMGHNGYGQLGRQVEQNPSSSKKNLEGQVPQLVDGMLGEKGSGCVGIDSGWSHCVALVQRAKSNGGEEEKVPQKQQQAKLVYGWGRNDKGQLGTNNQDEKIVPSPRLTHECVGSNKAIFRFCCGAESSMAIDEDGTLWGCGWNEHGNLATGGKDMGDVYRLEKVLGAHMPRVDHGAGNGSGRDLRKKNGEGGKAEKLLAVGGAHFLTMIS